MQPRNPHRRCPGRTAHPLWAGSRPEDRQGSWSHYASIATRSRRRGDWV